MAGRFADGVWLAELAAVRDPALVASVVAAALEVREQPGVPVADALARVLARQQLLLVLDNCEHVIGAAAELCAGLLPAADDVRILATSREPLRVAGEARYRLGPLTLPGPDDPADTRCEAVALFADRACHADVRFTLDGETGPVVARLVARLDGMPLAIELAAARVEALGVTQLLDRIDDRFRLLTAGDRLAAGRQRSLAATVQWSYQLLDEQEQRVFRACRYFPGRSRWRPPRRSRAMARGRRCCGWWTARCSSAAGRAGWPVPLSDAGNAACLRGRAAGRGREHDGAAAALARYALRVAEQAAAGLQTSAGEVAAARRLDAEDATMRQVLAWAMDHDAAMALAAGGRAGAVVAAARPAGRAVPAAARGRRPRRGGQRAGGAPRNLARWTAVSSADLAAALGHFTAVRDASGTGGRPGRWRTAWLAGQ